MKHHWGKRAEISSLRSCGRNTVFICVNCLAVKVIIEPESGPREGETKTSIVEFGGCELLSDSNDSQ